MRVSDVGVVSTVPAKLGPVSVIVSPPMRTSATVPVVGPTVAIAPPLTFSVLPSALIESIVRVPSLTPVIQTCWPTARPVPLTLVESTTVPPVAEPVSVDRAA